MRLIWTILFLFVPVMGVGLFAMSKVTRGGWLPDNITDSGGEIDWLFNIILWVTGIIFVVTEVLLVWAMWRSRGNEAGKAKYTHGNQWLEIGWTFGTAAILLYMAFTQMPIWAKAKYYHNRPAGKTPDVLVEASQFLWQVRYPGWDAAGQKSQTINTMAPNLSQTFELINELHVYAGEPFLVHVKSRDVLHCFWVPALRVKQDTVPGNVIPVWFKIDPEKLGDHQAHRRIATKQQPVMYGAEKFEELYEYEWVCAELCGWGHYRMRARMIVHPNRADYERWLKAASHERIAPPAVTAASAP